MKAIDEIVKQAEERARAEAEARKSVQDQETARKNAKKAEIISLVREMVLKAIDTNGVTLKILDNDYIAQAPVVEVFIFNDHYKWPVVAMVERVERPEKQVLFAAPFLSNNDNRGIGIGNEIYCDRSHNSPTFRNYVDALAYCIQSVEPAYQSMAVPGDVSGDDENYSSPIPKEYTGEELVSELTRIARHNDDETAVHALAAIGMMSAIQGLGEMVWKSQGEG